MLSAACSAKSTMSSSAVASGSRRWGPSAPGAPLPPLRRWMMSWAMRSPSCSQSDELARELGALGVVDQQVAQQQRGALDVSPATPRAARQTSSRGRARCSRAIATNASPRRAAKPGSSRVFHSGSRPGNERRRRAARCLRRHGGGTAPGTTSSASARSRSGRPTAWCSRRAGAEPVGARVRSAGRAGAQRRRDRPHARTSTRGVGRRRCAAATARSTSTSTSCA